MVLPAPYSAPRISRAVECPHGTPVRTLQYSRPHKHAPVQQENTHTARQAINRGGSVWWVAVVRTRRGASVGGLPDETLTWGARLASVESDRRWCGNRILTFSQKWVLDRRSG